MFLRRRSTNGRFGDRVIIEQPGVLELNGMAFEGTIHDVGPRGAYFAAEARPMPGAQGILRGPSGAPIAVRVVWSNRRGCPGVGLAFGAA